MTEAEEIARTAVANVDVDAVASDIEAAVLNLDMDDLGARSGRKRWGYVEPTEAAWALLEEAVEPVLEEMKRRVDLGFETAAAGTCAGIVVGLYRCRGKNSDQVLGWASDFPAETAGHAVATLARESAAKHGLTWRLPQAVVDQVPEWEIDRVSKPAPPRSEAVDAPAVTCKLAPHGSTDAEPR